MELGSGLVTVEIEDFYRVMSTSAIVSLILMELDRWSVIMLSKLIFIPPLADAVGWRRSFWSCYNTTDRA
jgi:hypothetical protein